MLVHSTHTLNAHSRLVANIQVDSTSSEAVVGYTLFGCLTVLTLVAYFLPMTSVSAPWDFFALSFDPSPPLSILRSTWPTTIICDDSMEDENGDDEETATPRTSSVL